MKCGCHCPHCDAPLYAKNAGQIREHHFAHAHGHECEGAYESSLHLLAKEVLQEAGRIMLPQSNSGTFPSGLVRIHNVEVEKWDEHYGFRPDVEGIMDNGERLLIEFLVSHKVDGKKRQTIVDNHLKCIEIDINYQALDRAELKEFLTVSTEDRKWIAPMPLAPKKAGGSFSYGRNSLYEKTRDVLKEVFDKGTLLIHPFQYSFSHKDQTFDLRKLGYDVCKVNTKYRGFKSDLLLYRSQKENKGYISLNIRGRRRSDVYKRPKGLRIIDVVLGYDTASDGIKKRFESSDLASNFGTIVYYFGFKK
ncbi:MAG: hypothetical protein LKI59_08165 [Bacteroidales bacterium]|jgi:hypothetical protein|nr:hypothetical protein [Bacteroidales bacterium]